MSGTCTHLGQIADVSPSSEGCEDCLRIDGWWKNLRMCMTCGHVGCCDSSPNRHATAHYNQEQHPIVQSYEPTDSWWWCYLDEVVFEVEGGPKFAHP